MKKTLLFTSVFTITLLTIVLLFTLPASADTVGGGCGKSGDNVSWSFDTKTGILTLSGSGEMCAYTTSDNVPWDIYREQIKEVVIEDGITSIGGYTFYRCSELKSVYIADSVTIIGTHAFQLCNQLKHLVLPSALTHIQSSAFENCTSLESVVIPHGTLVIGKSAFSECENLTSILIPNTVTTIEDRAFDFCKNLKTLVIPDSVTSIGNGILSHCNSLTSLTLPVGLEHSNAVDFNPHYFGYIFGGLDFYTNNSAVPTSLKTVIVTKMGSFFSGYFYGCENIETIVLPNSVWDIAPMTFEKCKGLKTIVLPTSFKNTQTSIRNNAFLDCNALTRVEYHGTTNQWAALTFEAGNDVIKNNVTLVPCSHAYWKAVDETHHQSVCTCNALLGEPVEHAWTEQEVLRASTHLLNGKTLYTCGCGVFKIVPTEKLLEHIWDAGVVTTEPTVETEGIKTFTCGCGETRTEAIAKLPAPEKNDSGCGSVLTSSLGMMALITLAGGMVAYKKKK